MVATSPSPRPDAGAAATERSAARTAPARRSVLQPVRDGQVRDGQVRDGQVRDGQVRDGQAPEEIVPAEVELTEGGLVVRDLLETDTDVLRVVREADDPADATRQCLRVGARAVLAANVTVETHIVEKRFDAMAERFEEQLESTVAQISERADALLDEQDGALPAVLDAHREQLDQLLGDTFDPHSKRSVLALFEEILSEAQVQQTRAMQALVAVDGDDSPLAVLRRGVVRDVGDALSNVRKDVQELSERLAVQEAVAPVLERTTGKGFAFEEVLDACLGRIAAAHGDIAERCGKEGGGAGTQKGDEIVTINPEDTQGYDVRFVLEAKSKKLTMRATLKELDAALENREALAAVAVFATQDQAPTSVPFHAVGDKAIVVLDKDGADDAALRLAYMWARWVARRDLGGASADELDIARIDALIADAGRAIDRCTTIRKHHSSARRSIELAATELTGLADDVRAALDAISDELSAADDTDDTEA